MTVRKLDDGKAKPWLAEVYPQGRDGPRKRKRFSTKGEALAYEAWATEQANAKPWLSSGDKPIVDNRRLSDLLDTWYRMHGRTLKSGDYIRRKLELVIMAIGDPVATSFTGAMFAKYRDDRLSGQIQFESSKRGAVIPKPVTINSDHRLMKSMFSELIRIGEWTNNNPLSTLRVFKVSEIERWYLTRDDISLLLDACRKSAIPDLVLIVELCLSTGARWSEIQNLTRAQVSKYRLTFVRTKSSKNRTIPISPELWARIPDKEGPLFAPCYPAFQGALNRSGIKLPSGQCSHVLRHTFASWFMMNGGNILVLQRILGHSSITMTMRYSHFAPDHLDDAVRLNPISLL